MTSTGEWSGINTVSFVANIEGLTYLCGQIEVAIEHRYITWGFSFHSHEEHDLKVLIDRSGLTSQTSAV